MPIAVPTPRFLFEALNIQWVYHLTPLGALSGIIRRVHSRPGEWAHCDLALAAGSGWDASGKRLFRDYSLLDFELKLQGRGRYTYFFGGEPSAWGLKKNLGLDAARPAEDQGWATLRIAVPDLLARYQGPLFCRPDDAAVVIRGGYEGPGQAKPLPIPLAAPVGAPRA